MPFPLGAPGPEETGQHDIERDQRRGEERDLTAEQAEAGIDVGGEGLQEAIDDARIVHGFTV
jgi:hypothetical protein